MSGYGSDLADVEIELKGNKYPHIVVGEWPVLEESCLWEEENRSELNTFTFFHTNNPFTMTLFSAFVS